MCSSSQLHVFIKCGHHQAGTHEKNKQTNTQLRLGVRSLLFTRVLYKMDTYQVGLPWERR